MRLGIAPMKWYVMRSQANTQQWSEAVTGEPGSLLDQPVHPSEKDYTGGKDREKETHAWEVGC